jgi:hypothetical protein
MFVRVHSVFGLNPRPRNPTDCVRAQQTDRAAKVEHRAVEP